MVHNTWELSHKEIKQNEQNKRCATSKKTYMCEKAHVSNFVSQL